MSNEIMTPEAFFDELNLNSKKRHAFILGNGFNLHYLKKDDQQDDDQYKWGWMLKKIARNYTNDRRIDSLYKNEDITNTEKADFISCCEPKDKTVCFEKCVAQTIKNEYEKKYQPESCRLLEFAWKNKFHILTPNFDENIENFLKDHNRIKLKNFHIPSDKSASAPGKIRPVDKDRVQPSRQSNSPRTQFQWNMFSSDKDYSDLNSNFDIHRLEHDIWHIHGRKNRGNSSGILLTSTKYANAISHYQRAGGHQPDGGKLRNTWVKLFFECPLIIAGFKLTATETFLRYLILQRFREYRRTPQNSFYLFTKEDGDKDGREFLKAAGITPVEFPTWNSLYGLDGLK